MIKKWILLLACCGISFGAAAKIYSFPVNPPREYDFLNKDEIFRVRNEMTKKYPVFFKGDYKAGTGSVFRQVENKKPWWGLKGLMCYGPGKLSIEGESDESRFIDNPFLLVSMEEGFALPLMKGKGNCPLSYPKPTKITFNTKTNTFTVNYDASTHERVLAAIAHKNHAWKPKMEYSFNGRNAIDFGIPYVYAEASKNIRFLSGKNMKTAPYRFRDFIHVGGSCGYPGGCNNGSPHQAETDFQITGYPAYARFKLWRKKPKSADDPADMMYEININ